MRKVRIFKAFGLKTDINSRKHFTPNHGSRQMKRLMDMMDHCTTNLMISLLFPN